MTRIGSRFPWDDLRWDDLRFALVLALVALFVLATLSGCGLTPQGDALRNAIAGEGREAAAAGLENAEWYLCRASPVGAVVDRYGASETQWGAWSTICLDRSPAVAAPPLTSAGPPGALPGPPLPDGLPPSF